MHLCAPSIPFPIHAGTHIRTTHTRIHLERNQIHKMLFALVFTLSQVFLPPYSFCICTRVLNVKSIFAMGLPPLRTHTVSTQSRSRHALVFKGTYFVFLPYNYQCTQLAKFVLYYNTFVDNTNDAYLTTPADAHSQAQFAAHPFRQISS